MLRRILIATPLVNLAVMTPLRAQGPLVDSSVVTRLRTLEFADTVWTDLAPIASRIRQARIVVLGEATHGEGATSQAKARLVRFLHEQMGFDVLVWEGGLLDAWRLNAGLRGSEPIAHAATYLMRGGWDESVYARPVFDYARRTWTTERPLLMAGFDVGRPPRGARNLMSLLDLIFARVPELRPDSADLARVEGMARRVFGYFGSDTTTVSAAERQRRRQVLERILARFEQEDAGLLAGFGERERRFIRVAVRSALADEAINEEFAQRGALEWNRMRDSVMGERLGVIADSLYPGQKLIVWAATAHMVRNSGSISSLNPEVRYGTIRVAGDYAGEQFGEDLYTIGFVAHGGLIGDVFEDDDRRGPGEVDTLSPPQVGSFEAAAHELGMSAFFVDLRRLPADHPLNGSFVSHVLGYIPNRARWSEIIDAFLFIDQAKPERHHSR